MHIAPICIGCNLGRKLIDVSPVANGHEMRSFECLECKSVFRLVVPCELQDALALE